MIISSSTISRASSISRSSSSSSPSSSSSLRSYSNHQTRLLFSTRPNLIHSSNHHRFKIISNLNLDHAQLTPSISLFIKAGTRSQPSQGIAHLLKNSLFKSTQKRSALSLVRETELLGGLLTSSITREHLILTAQFLRGNEGYFAEVLGDVLTSSNLSRHEFNEEVLPGAIAEYHQAQLNPTIVAFDQAHQLAFRKGLGNSLFLNPDVPVSHDSVIDFARSSFANPQGHTIVSTGIETEKLKELVDRFFDPSTSSSSSHPLNPSASIKSTYHGGHSRITRGGHGGSEDAFLIGFKGSDGGSTHPEYTVLQHLLGSEPSSIKWSNGTSPLAPLPVKAFHLPYSDIGLFGLFIRAPSSQIKSIASKALSELRNVANGNSIDPSAVSRAISKAKFLIASSLESNVAQNEILGTRTDLSHQAPQQLEDLYSSYSQVTPEKVIQAAKSILKSSPTTVAIGNTDELPHFDELEGL